MYIAGVFKLPVIFFCILLAYSGRAQRAISGKITDATTGAAIAGCSVFIAGSSNGTVSAADGRFILQAVPAGKNDVVISSIGYETFVTTYTDHLLPLVLDVRLKTRARELETVVLEPYVTEGWDRWGKLFTDNFIGVTPNAARCRIRNTKAIRFRYYKGSNRLVAYCEEPLLIENKALGYLLKYQLETFEVNFSRRSTVFLGYPFFEDMDQDRENGASSRHAMKRAEAYHGSIIHFMRALYQNRLDEEGFLVRRMQRIPNLEKERVKLLFRTNPPVKPGQPIIITTGPGREQVAADGKADSSAYYRRVLNQPDHQDIYDTVLLTADSILVNREHGFKALWFSNYLAITYDKGMEDPAYAQGQYPARKPWHPRSLVILADGEPVILDENGNYYDPQQFFTSGYWGWSEKIANSLPVEYTPDQDHPPHQLRKP